MPQEGQQKGVEREKVPCHLGTQEVRFVSRSIADFEQNVMNTHAQFMQQQILNVVMFDLISQ